MINRADLVYDCQKLVGILEDSIRSRALSDPESKRQQETEYAELVKNDRISAAFAAWLDERVTQAAVSWVLGCVFVRFLEDNGMIPKVYLSGPVRDLHGVNRMEMAEQTKRAWVLRNATGSDTDYLAYVFSEIGKEPACADLFARGRNPLWQLAPQGDGATRLLDFWNDRNADGALKHDFSAENSAAIADTRFLGDLYQDLSTAAREKYALLQTPDFIEEFILNYTLTPALDTFGLMPKDIHGKPTSIRVVDPTCGSGHFLLETFRRILAAWQIQEPGTPIVELVRRSLASVHGIDLNPFAVAIARFRLLIAALVACRRTRLADLPNFHLNLACGDALLMGTRDTQGRQQFIGEAGAQWRPDHLVDADYDAANELLSLRYHVVVGNPPYISVEDAKIRDAVKRRYPISCFRKWTLSVPFIERFFEIAVKGSSKTEAGYVGFINSNNFTKREFGAPVIEKIIPSTEVTHVCDTSGCVIKDHDTPTVILFARNRSPVVGSKVRIVQGIRGEPRPYPADNSKGKVWQSILSQIDQPGSSTQWISVVDVPRESLAGHPWSLGGGGASDVKELLERDGTKRLSHFVDEHGVCAISAADDIIIRNERDFRRSHYEPESIRSLVSGDVVRDWSCVSQEAVFFPYLDKENLADPTKIPRALKDLWPYRSTLHDRPTFGGGTYKSDGRKWWCWHQVAFNRLKTPLTITWGEVSTHNHFALSRGGIICKQTAPVIKLTKDKTTDDHLWIIGVLNSSSIAFWLKQVCTCKGGPGGGKTFEDLYLNYYALNASNIADAPITEVNKEKVISLSRQIDLLAQRVSENLPSAVCGRCVPTAGILAESQKVVNQARGQMASLQEELDWLVYQSFGIISASEAVLSSELPDIQSEERAFAIHLAREVKSGAESRSWFEHHQFPVLENVPASWPASYRKVVDRRLHLIASHPFIRLLERPEYKRRWSHDAWVDQEKESLRIWLCDRLESKSLWPDQPQITTCNRLADQLRTDRDFHRVAACYCKSDTFDMASLVRELIVDEAVPYLPALRFTDSGLRKREEWERTWELQRQEDAGKSVVISPPRRYDSKDFVKSCYWSKRGKVDASKERFISYPSAEKATDSSPVILWAGYNHQQQSRALAEFILTTREEEGWSNDRFIPLLACIDQLIPWVKQWHNSPDPDLGQGWGDYLANWLNQTTKELGYTVETLRSWKPAPPVKGKKKPKSGDAKS